MNYPDPIHAEALLAKCGSKLTGRELHIIDRILDGRMEEVIDTLLMIAEDENLEDDDLEGELDYFDETIDADDIKDQLSIFRHMEIQFSREIADFIDEVNRAASRRATEAAIRLNTNRSAA